MTLTTFDDAFTYFRTEDHAIAFMHQLRWPVAVSCPRCGSHSCHALRGRAIWQCVCRHQFSVKTGTIFAGSHLPLGTWLAAIWLIANARGEIQATDIQRALAVSEKTGLSLLRRVRSVMAEGHTAQPAVSPIDSQLAIKTIWLDDIRGKSVMLNSSVDRFISLARHILHRL